MAPVNTIQKGNLKALFHNGELVSFSNGPTEFMHGGGKIAATKTDADKKGWQHSELLMFPIAGPADDFMYQLDSTTSPMDQHGASRYLPFVVRTSSVNSISFVQEYTADTPVLNGKYQPDNGKPQFISMPASYRLEKTFTLEEDRLVVDISITNTSDKTIPYMLGWHPAFKVIGDPKAGKLVAPDAEVSLEHILNAKTRGEDAEKIEGASSMMYLNEDLGISLEVSTTGFRHMMLWSPSPDSGMFCIEPLTRLPPYRRNSSENIDYIDPGQSVKYQVVITPTPRNAP